MHIHFRSLLIVSLLFGSNPAMADLDMMKSLYMGEGPEVSLKDDKEFEMSGELGLLLNSGNTEALSLAAGLEAEQEYTNWSNRYKGNLLYKRNEQELDGKTISNTSAHRLFLSAQMDYKLEEQSNRLFMYGEYDNDRFSGFKYQAAFAAGWTSLLWRNDASEFKYSIGPGYSHNEIEEDELVTDDSGFIVRAAIEYKCKFSDTATFRQFISTEADSDFSKSRMETSLSAKINQSLAMKLSLLLNHNSSVDDTSERLDTKTAVTVVYQFF